MIISNVYSGLITEIRRLLQGSCWQRCRMRCVRNLLQTVPKAHQEMVAAALHSVFAKEKTVEIEPHRDDLTSSPAEQFPVLAGASDTSNSTHIASLKPTITPVVGKDPAKAVNHKVSCRTKPADHGDHASRIKPIQPGRLYSLPWYQQPLQQHQPRL